MFEVLPKPALEIGTAGLRNKLMPQLAVIRNALAAFRIRDASDYAEELVAEALDGERLLNKVAKGHDVRAPRFGRIEVKCRQLPRDGRVEERIALGASKEDGLDRTRSRVDG